MAMEANVLDAVYQDMRDIKLSIYESADFKMLLKSPVIKPDQKKSILEAVLKNQTALTRQFASYLVDKKREMFFESICAAFIDQYLKLKGIATATVTSAFQLDGNTLTSVKQYLSSTFSLDEIILENKIDKSIIGGMIIQYEDRRLDMSVLKELQELKKQLIYN